MIVETVLLCTLVDLLSPGTKFPVSTTHRTAIYSDKVVEAFKPGSEAPRVIANPSLARTTLVFDFHLTQNKRFLVLNVKNYLTKDNQKVVGVATMVSEDTSSASILSDTLVAPIWLSCEKTSR